MLLIINASQEDSRDFDSHSKTSRLPLFCAAKTVWSGHTRIPRTSALSDSRCCRRASSAHQPQSVRQHHRGFQCSAGADGLSSRTEQQIQIPASGLAGVQSTQTADRALAVQVVIACHMTTGHMITPVSWLSKISQEISRISYVGGDFFLMGNKQWRWKKSHSEGPRTSMLAKCIVVV